MTPADESLFITLWQQGASQQELAARLGVPVGTIKSRASALARQGKIQARPKGGAYPWQRHQAAMAPVQSGADMHGAQAVQGSAVQNSAEESSSNSLHLKTAEQGGAVQNSAEPSPTALVPSPAVASAAIIDLLRQTLARLDTVEQDLKAIREDRQPGAGQGRVGQGSAEQGSAEAPALSPDEARAERWNLWLPRGLRVRIEALAQARGVAPSRVVQELLWQALTERHTSTP